MIPVAKGCLEQSDITMLSSDQQIRRAPVRKSSISTEDRDTTPEQSASEICSLQLRLLHRYDARDSEPRIYGRKCSRSSNPCRQSVPLSRFPNHLNQLQSEGAVLFGWNIRNAELQRLPEVRIPYGAIPTGTGFSVHDNVCLLQTRNELSVKANPTPAPVPVDYEHPRPHCALLLGVLKPVIAPRFCRCKRQSLNLVFRRYALDVCKVLSVRPIRSFFIVVRCLWSKTLLCQVYQCPSKTGFPLKA